MAIIRKNWQLYAVINIPKDCVSEFGCKQIWRSLKTADKYLALSRYYEIMIQLSKQFQFIRDKYMTTKHPSKKKDKEERHFALKAVDIPKEIQSIDRTVDEYTYTKEQASALAQVWARLILENLYLRNGDSSPSNLKEEGLSNFNLDDVNLDGFDLKKEKKANISELDGHDHLKLCLLRRDYEIIKPDCGNFLFRNHYPLPTRKSEATVLRSFIIAKLCCINAFKNHTLPDVMELKISFKMNFKYGSGFEFEFAFDDSPSEKSASSSSAQQSRPENQSTSSSDGLSKDKTLIEICDELLKIRRNIKEDSAKTTRSKVNVLQEMLGNSKTINNINIDDLYELVNNKLPYLSKRFGRVHQMTISDAILEGQKDHKKAISAKTLDGYMICLKMIFKYAVKKGYIQTNLAEDLIAKSVAPKPEKRLPFSIPQLNAMFAMSDFQKKSEQRDHKFWLPLIALFTGMRLEEIAQLHVSDIKEEDGIHYIDVTDGLSEEGKSLKTQNAKRKIPIVDKLIQLGFLDYVKSKTASVRLFPELKKGGKDKWSAAYSKYFGRFLPKVNESISHQTDKLIKGRHVFHSFRHTVKSEFNKLNYTQADKDRFFEMMGWSEDESTGNSYGQFDLKTTAEMLNNALVYEGLDLSRLIPPKKEANS